MVCLFFHALVLVSVAGARNLRGRATRAPQLREKLTARVVGTAGQYLFEGEFVDDFMQGQGRFVYPSGAEYKGQWSRNKYNGNGRYTWPDGKVYEGAFVDNVMHGDGSIHDNHGRSWSGKFSQGSGPGLTYDLP